MALHFSAQTSPRLGLDFPVVALSRQYIDQSSFSSAWFALEHKRQRSGKNDVGALPNDFSVDDLVVRDILAGNIELMRPLLSISEPSTLSVWPCPAIWSHPIDNDDIAAECAVEHGGLLAVEGTQSRIDHSLDFSG